MLTLLAFTSEARSSEQFLYSDEYFVLFQSQSLGLVLSEEFYKGFPIVVVKEKLGSDNVNNPELTQGSIIVQVANEQVDGLPLSKISSIIKGSPRPTLIKFRDPNRL